MKVVVLAVVDVNNHNSPDAHHVKYPTLLKTKLFYIFQVTWIN